MIDFVGDWANASRNTRVIPPFAPRARGEWRFHSALPSQRLSNAHQSKGRPGNNSAVDSLIETSTVAKDGRVVL